nr:hypothetical protein [uncultured Rhodopila sp.]
MLEAELPPIRPYHPTTFLERGVAVPFTTPRLGGTRARPAKKHLVELVVPNLSGGRGVYVMPWSSLTALCRPTLHDKVFSQRIASISNVTPATIRRVARQIAAEGLAGEEAMEAARVATDADKGDRVVTNYRLLMTLVEQVVRRFAPASLTEPGSHALDPSERARLAVDWISPRLGQTTTWTANALEELADVMANIGVGSVGATGRTPRLTNMLRAVRASVADWSGTQREEDQASYAKMFCKVADVTLSLAQTTVAKAQALPDNMVDLLRTWAADRDSVIELVGRPEWLLDGWEQICLVWNNAVDDAARRAALAEIATLVPILPKEVNDWCSMSNEIDGIVRFRRVINLNEDWFTGAMMFDLIRRNEHFRAITV